jgi:acyl carrier protein
MITIEKIHNIIRNNAPSVDVSKIEEHVKLREYGIDSMDFYNIVLELEEILGQQIPDEDIDQLRTVADIQKYFNKHNA